jgi:tRNA(fMet)-specific endonuclease VapC
MSYLLDATTLLEVLRASPAPPFVRRLTQVPSRERFTSVITVSQLLLAARERKSNRVMRNVVKLVAAIRVLPYDLGAAERFAKLRATVAPDRETDDVMMAAVATSRALTLVTRRVTDFAPYPDLRVEDWTR